MTEAQVYADYLKKEKPNAKVAVLYQNDGFGKDLLGGFEEAIKGSNVKVVAKESYEVTDPTIASQMSKLASSGADTFLNITTPKFSAQAIAAVAKSDWKPLHILNNVGASKTLVLTPAGLDNAKGIVSTAYFKDPEDPQWADDPAMKEYKAELKKYAPRANPDDPFNVYGWGAARDDGRGAEGHEGADPRGAHGLGAQHGPGDPDPAAGDQGPDGRATTATRSRRCRSCGSTASTGSCRATSSRPSGGD